MESDKFIGKRFLIGDDIVFVRTYNDYSGVYICDVKYDTENWVVHYTVDYLDRMVCISDSTVLEAIYGGEE